MNEKNNSRPKIRTASVLSGFCQSPDMRALCFLFLLLSASCSFMFRDYLYGNDLMIFNDIGSDTWQQYIMNYTSIVNHLRDGSFSLWDFNNGLGINQFNFNLFDPFLMLLYGAGVILGPAHMLLYINVIQILAGNPYFEGAFRRISKKSGSKIYRENACRFISYHGVEYDIYFS